MAKVSAAASYHFLLLALGLICVGPSGDTRLSAFSPGSTEGVGLLGLPGASAAAVRSAQPARLKESEDKDAGTLAGGYDDEDDDDEVVPIKPRSPTLRSISQTGHRRK